MTIPTEAQTQFREAIRLERSGRVAEAEAAYERLLERWPNHPDSWYNLALLQRRGGRFEAALASYEQALARGISRPEEVHLNRGVIYSDCLRRDDDALRELRAALALNPAYAPALFNLANLNRLGEREQALAAYEQPRHRSARRRGPRPLRRSARGFESRRSVAGRLRGHRAAGRHSRGPREPACARQAIAAAPTTRLSRPRGRQSGEPRERGPTAILYDRKRQEASSTS